MQLEPHDHAIIPLVFGDVQLAALRLAYRNKTIQPADRFGEDWEGWADHRVFVDQSHDIYIWEVLMDFYGWVPKSRHLWGPKSKELSGAQRFSLEKIGESEYRNRSASVSRALTLLEKRGYMERVRGAADLTAAGVELCERLFGHT